MFASSSTTTLIKITSFLISLVVSLIVPSADNILSLPFLPLLDSGARFKVTTPGWSLEFELGQPSSRYLPKASSRIPFPLATPKAIAPTDIIIASVRADSHAGRGSDVEEADRSQNLASVLAALQARQSAIITSSDTTPSTPPSTPRRPPTAQSSRRSWIPTSDAMQGLAAVLVGARQFGSNSGTVRTSTSIHPVHRQPPTIASPSGADSTVFTTIQNSHSSGGSSTTSIPTISPAVASCQPPAQTITPRRRTANSHQLAAILITSHQERHSRSSGRGSGGRRSSFPAPPPLPLPMPKTPVQWRKEKAEKDGDPDDEDPEDGGAESNSEPKDVGLWSLVFCLVVVSILFWYPGRWIFKLFLGSVQRVIMASSRVSSPKVISSSRSMSMNIHSSGPVQATPILSSQASPSSTRIFSTQKSMSMHDAPSGANIRSDPIVHPPPHTKALSIYQVPSAPIVLTNSQTPPNPPIPIISQIPHIIQPPTAVPSQLPCLTLLASAMPIFIPALRIHHLIAILIGVLVVVFWWAHVGNYAIAGLVRCARKKDEKAVIPDQQPEVKAREVTLAAVVKEGCKRNMKEGGTGTAECDGDIPSVGLENEVEGVSDRADSSFNENASALSSLNAAAISSMTSAEEPASVDAPTSSEGEVTPEVHIPPSSSATSVAPASLGAVAARTALPPDSPVPTVANIVTPTLIEISPTSPSSASIAAPTMLFVTTPVSIEAVATLAAPSPSASTPPSSAKLRVSAPIFTPARNDQEKENVAPDQSNQDTGKELAVPSTVHDDVFVARPTVSPLVVRSNSEPYSPLAMPPNTRSHAIPIMQPLSKSRKIKIRKKRSKETKARILAMLAADGIADDSDEHDGEEDAAAESSVSPVTVPVSVASPSVNLPPCPPPPTYQTPCPVTQQNQPVNQDRGLSSSRHAAFDHDRGLHSSQHAVFNHDLSLNSSRHAAVNQDRGLSSSRHAAINQDRGLNSSRHAPINCDRGLNSSRHAVQPHDFQHKHYGGGGSNTHYPRGSQPRYAPYSC
ncbi:hypothetical protein BDQ12DRAFT_214923 [Crucibulum laeve]|uniref:Uncharacterized protein n=1 Tax=Crucibulum laeve TaxID=68775 RepID=A0A5C3LX02_9AGAR|nr:hypothetical protein BDQ12DRAFT_214923 [Crucibulum laeve]